MFGADSWLTIGSIIAVNLLLSGDNAVVIALASRRLGDADRRKALIWGTVGAVVFLVASAALVALLIQVPFLDAAGGLLLAWIAVKLLTDDEDADIEAPPTLLSAIRTIIVADVVMSFDNMVAVAGEAHGQLLLIGVGLAISIPIIVFGAGAIGRAMQRFPILVYLGAAFLGWTSGTMIVGDEALAPHLPHDVALILPFAEALLLLGIGHWLSGRDHRRKLDSGP